MACQSRVQQNHATIQAASATAVTFVDQFTMLYNSILTSYSHYRLDIII